MTHPDFARAAAHITAETVRDVLVKGREARTADPDFCWRNLADMLDSLAESVSRKSDLRAHLQRIAVTGGHYDLAKNEIVPAHFDVLSGGDGVASEVHR